MFKVFEFMAEAVGWLQIVASLFLIGLGIGAVTYYYLIPDTAGIVIGISIAISGLILGVIVATKIWKTKGTIWFLSRVSATPELDNQESNEHNKDFTS